MKPYGADLIFASVQVPAPLVERAPLGAELFLALLRCGLPRGGLPLRGLCGCLCSQVMVTRVTLST